MMKKGMAFCAAAAALSMLGTLTVSSADYYVKKITPIYLEGIGCYGLESQTMFQGIMIRTDGTALTDEMLNSVTGCTDLESWADFTANAYSGTATLTDIEGDENTYMLHIDSNDRNALSAIGRNLMLMFDQIEAVNVVDRCEYSRVAIGNELHIIENEENSTFDVAGIPELAGYEIEYTERSNSYRCYAPDTLTAELAEQGLKESERYAYFRELSDTILEKYSGEFADVFPHFYALDDIGLTEHTAASVWDSAGDPNSDGAVDSTDAAELLAMAAEIGTGAELPVTAAADVNADSCINAADAAAVLSYAAANGSGSEVSWVDILSR